ncbi:MAG: hypothetical protein SH868_19525 [Bythopirellula sp.]|nr:hypothetical protein [Bythopirellula sp.]
MLRLFSSGLMSFALLISTASAQQTETVLPVQDIIDNTVWEVHLQVERLFASPLGEIINDIVRKEAPDKELHLDAMVKALGFDPRTDVGEVIVFGDDFEHTSATALVNIGPSRGNIEGWLLAAPGYKSELLDDETIMHSFLVEDKELPRMWCAIPFSKADKSHILVASFDRDKTTSLAQHFALQGVGPLGKRLQDNTFLTVSVNDLSKAPFEIDENEPGSAIVKTIQSLTLEAVADTEQLTAKGEVTTDSPARAQQLNQLIVGMKAMVQLALPEKDPNAKEFAELLNNLNVEYAEGSENLSANFSIGYDVIQQMIEAKHGHH